MANEQQDAIDDRNEALVKALHHMNLMKYEMTKAQPGVTHDCWFSVINSLCDIASNIVSAQKALNRNSEQFYDGN